MRPLPTPISDSSADERSARRALRMMRSITWLDSCRLRLWRHCNHAGDPCQRRTSSIAGTNSSRLRAHWSGQHRLVESDPLAPATLDVRHAVYWHSVLHRHVGYLRSALVDDHD